MAERRAPPLRTQFSSNRQNGVARSAASHAALGALSGTAVGPFARVARLVNSLPAVGGGGALRPLEHRNFSPLANLAPRAGFRDLGGARPGVFCKFGGAEDLVPAEGSGEDEIVCASPPLPDVESGAACAAAVTIEVTINGDNPAGGAAMYAGDDGARFQLGDVEGVA